MNAFSLSYHGNMADVVKQCSGQALQPLWAGASERFRVEGIMLRNMRFVLAITASATKRLLVSSLHNELRSDSSALPLLKRKGKRHPEGMCGGVSELS